MSILNLEETRRQAIINSALREFALKGYDLASTNEIARHADISKALMFHYTSSKEELFLFLIDYCDAETAANYSTKIDMTEPDIFKRLQQSYLLQLNLLVKNPWLLAFNNLSAETKSERINEKITTKVTQDPLFCFDVMFEGIDESVFIKTISAAKCKQLIYWSNVGFIDQLVNNLKNLEYSDMDYDELVDKILAYFTDMRAVFYD